MGRRNHPDAPQPIPGERWRVIPGFCNRYAVSDHGRFLSRWKTAATADEPCPRLLGVHGTGVALRRDGKAVWVRPGAVVLDLFPDGHFRGEGPRNQWVTEYLDGDFRNCARSNLRWRRHRGAACMSAARTASIAAARVRAASQAAPGS